MADRNEHDDRRAAGEALIGTHELTGPDGETLEVEVTREMVDRAADTGATGASIIAEAARAALAAQGRDLEVVEADAEAVTLRPAIPPATVVSTGPGMTCHHDRRLHVALVNQPGFTGPKGGRTEALAIRGDEGPELADAWRSLIDERLAAGWQRTTDMTIHECGRALDVIDERLGDEDGATLALWVGGSDPEHRPNPAERRRHSRGDR